MEQLVARLGSLRPRAVEICNIAGTAGASIGILHHGAVVHTENIGFRDRDKGLAPDSDTIYYLSSMTKSFTAAAVSILVNRGRLDWDTPVSTIIPELQHRDTNISKHASIVDFLSHRTGLTPRNHVWNQEYGYLSLWHEDTIKTVTYLEIVREFRASWLYNNWGYAIADHIIERLSNFTWGSFLRSEILSPLGMDRTIFGTGSGRDNVAEGYMTLSTGEPHHLPRIDGGDGTVMEGATTARSSINDLLKYYRALMRAAKDQKEHGTTQTPGLPFVDTKTMLSAHIPLSHRPSPLERSYALGWVRTMLPGPLGAIGMNDLFVDRMPVVGRGLETPRMCIYHQGNSNTFLSAVYLLPDTESAVVVLTNTMAQNDAADWIGEMYLQSLLGENVIEYDYVAWAKSSAEASREFWPAMRRELEENQIPGTTHRPLHNYVGTYVNIIGNYKIEIRETDGVLTLQFQRSNVTYFMDHYHYDTFSWILTQDQDAQVGRFPVMRASYYLIRFVQSKDAGGIDQLVWIHDDEVLTGETFFMMPKEVVEEIIDTPALTLEDVVEEIKN